MSHARPRAVQSIALAAAALCFAASALAQAAPRPPFDANAPAETQFKNIKVLQGIHAGDLRDAMEFIAASLGTGCGHCHARGGMDKDDKPAKETARKMIRMVQGINRDMFEGKNVVTCTTCHAGRTKPVSIPAFDAPAMAADAFVKDRLPDERLLRQPPAPPPLPSAQAVVDKFVAAIGGQAALDKLGALQVHATQADDEHPASIDMTWQPPASIVATLRAGEGERLFVFTQGSDGATTWGQMGDQPAQDLHGLRRAQALHEGELLPAITFGAGSAKMEVLARGKIADKSVIAMSVTGGDGAVDMLYFDGTSGLLLRRSYEVTTPLGSIPNETDYSDWKSVNGVLLPHGMRSKLPAESSMMTLDTVEPAAGVTAATFAKPADKP